MTAIRLSLSHGSSQHEEELCPKHCGEIVVLWMMNKITERGGALETDNPSMNARRKTVKSFDDG